MSAETRPIGAGVAEIVDPDGAFPRLDGGQRARLRALGRVRTVESSEVLFAAGDESSDFFVIESGAVAIVQGLGEENRVIAIQGVHRFLGELGLIIGQRLYPSAVVRDPGELIQVPFGRDPPTTDRPSGSADQGMNRPMSDGTEITMQPLDPAVDHVRGSAGGRLIVEYGDYECPYSRRAFREIERLERGLGDDLRFGFRHFPLTEIHPHALAASVTAEAAAVQERFWDMHGLLFRHQDALADDDLRQYVAELGLDLAAFEADRADAATLRRVRRDVDSGMASGEVRGTPTLFIDGVVHRGAYDAASLKKALAG